MAEQKMPSATLQKNEQHAGLELSFSAKPDQSVIDALKQNGFRWHTKKRLWFAKDTPERYAFAAEIAGITLGELKSQSTLQVAQTNDLQSESIAKTPLSSKPNTFAASYDEIGDAKIVTRAQGTLSTFSEAFFLEENIHYRRTFGNDCISITDLTNAQKTGAVCTTWRVGIPYGENDRLMTLLAQAGIDTVPQLLDACRNDKSLDGISITQHESKGVDTFSPFVEVKPLKVLPDKWTKRTFTQALMSGQLYRGEVAYRYTDDYAYDAAVGFRTGVGLDIPSFAKNEVGEWGSCTSCYNSKDAKDEYGGSAVSYSEHTNSGKTFWFDVNCDIAEGKKRAALREESIDRYNKMLEASCIQLSPQKIAPEKCYTVMTLDIHTNTGVHSTKEEVLQGHVLQSRLDPDGYCPPLLKAEELLIEPSKLYVVADFFHRREYAEDDERIIHCGNWKQVVTGKALLEFNREGTVFPVLHTEDMDCGTYEKAKEHLSAQASGRSGFLFSKKEDFAESLARLETEYQRAGKPSLEHLLHGAHARRSHPFPSSPLPEQER